jgi:hypothetical protein
MNFWGVLQLAFMLISAGTGIVVMAISLRKARTIEDTPTAKIRSVAQGYNSISGIARAIDTDSVIAPLTKRPCLWYHYTIERRDSDDDGSHWTTIEQGTSEIFFALDDSTGVCHIDPRRAEVTAAISQRWEGDERKPFGPPRGSSSSFFSKRYRYTENRIHAQEWVYALGWFETLHAPSLAERTEAQTKLLLNEWKQNQDALLARFDLNRDGEISMPEWERARRAARQQAEQEVRNEPSAPAINILSRSPLRDQPYLIGTKDPQDIARKYRRDAFLALVIGFAFTALIFWKFYRA